MTTIYDTRDMEKPRPSSPAPRSRYQSTEVAAIMPDFKPKLSGATVTLEYNDFSALPDSSASDATDSSNMEMFSLIDYLQDEDDSATTKRVLTKMETESDESINPEAPMADNEIG
jgi:hypothetical protein